MLHSIQYTAPPPCTLIRSLLKSCKERARYWKSQGCWEEIEETEVRYLYIKLGLLNLPLNLYTHNNILSITSLNEFSPRAWHLLSTPVLRYYIVPRGGYNHVIYRHRIKILSVVFLGGAGQVPHTISSQ